MAGALDGIRVVDQTQVMAGPFASMLLADMGADVIKVEPPEGEHARHVGLEIAPGVGASFLAVNRGKKGMTLDLKQPDGVAVLKRLVATADVLVENYRPGVAARLGVDYDTLAAVNRRLIYCSVSGFGQTGPYASRGGYDLIAQGMAGIMSATGSDGGPPVKVGVPIADLGAGLFALLGILAALRARRITGRGQRVDTSLADTAAIRATYNEASTIAERLWQQSMSEGRPDPGAARGMVDTLAQAVAQNRTALVALTALKSYDNYTFTHMVNVSILTMGQAKALGIEGRLLREFGLSALMHDIGKVRTPKEILNKPDKLTDPEFEIMKRHVVDGAEILRRTPEMPPMAPVVALRPRPPARPPSRCPSGAAAPTTAATARTSPRTRRRGRRT